MQLYFVRRVRISALCEEQFSSGFLPGFRRPGKRSETKLILFFDVLRIVLEQSAQFVQTAVG